MACTLNLNSGMNQEIFNQIKEFAVRQAAVEEDEVTESASIED